VPNNGGNATEGGGKCFGGICEEMGKEFKQQAMVACFSFDTDGMDGNLIIGRTSS